MLSLFWIFLLLEVLGIQLGWYAQYAVVDGSHVSQLLLLGLPGDKGLPKTVGTKVGPCCKYCMFVGTKEGKTILNFSYCI